VFYFWLLSFEPSPNPARTGTLSVLAGPGPCRPLSGVDLSLGFMFTFVFRWYCSHWNFHAYTEHWGRGFQSHYRSGWLFMFYCLILILWSLVTTEALRKDYLSWWSSASCLIIPLSQNSKSEQAAYLIISLLRGLCVRRGAYWASLFYYYLFTAIGFAPGGSGPYTTQLQQKNIH
jgi:hypothetical protein